MDEASQNNCNSGEGTTVSGRVSTNPSSSNETPENPQESESDNISSDALAIALSSMLTAVIKDFDSKAQDTLQSQDQLASAIDRLTGELDQLLEDAPLPFIMQYAAKILGVRKRVSSLNSLLKSIQQRVDIIDRLLKDSRRKLLTVDELNIGFVFKVLVQTEESLLCQQIFSNGFLVKCLADEQKQSPVTLNLNDEEPHLSTLAKGIDPSLAVPEFLPATGRFCFLFSSFLNLF
ncbi:hypothetical protein CUMW_219140 [Citrus unshiu]|uniref:Biogenesis of lysosome-related organelles complex 1 subunit 7 n=2 Tax=Citrus unshiu TaxID=55188 RepID=A0A2H5QDD3_CITUN|nr:hypothetical protein CUMW_219140 [Citrus unshiu]